MTHSYFLHLRIAILPSVCLLLATAGVAQPDLLFTSAEITGADRFANLGQTRTLELRFRNDGTVNAEGVADDVAIGLYLSRDATFSADDCFVEEFGRQGRIIPTSPNISGSLSGRVVQLPVERYAGGDYFLIAVIDYLDANAELNEDNNAIGVAVTLRGTAAEDGCGTPGGGGGGGGNPDPVADVSVTASLEASDRVSDPGDRVSVDYVVRNDGPIDVDDLPVGFYLSEDRAFDDGDVFLESEEVDVDAGDVEPEFEQVPLPDGIAPGDYFFLVVLDPRDRLAETDEANNVAALPIEIAGDDPTPAGANLTVTSATASTSGTSRVTVDFTVTNSGSQSAAPSYIVFYTSADDQRGGDDRYFAYARLPELAPGASRRLQGTVSTRVDRPGDYYVISVTDFTNAVAESNESDNVTAVFTGGGDAKVIGRSPEPLTDAPTVPLSEAEDLVAGVLLAPNPANATVSVRLERIPGATAVVSMTDVTGRELLRRELPAQDFAESTEQVDVSALPAGVYNVSVVHGDHVAASRLVVRH